MPILRKSTMQTSKARLNSPTHSADGQETATSNSPYCQCGSCQSYMQLLIRKRLHFSNYVLVSIPFLQLLQQSTTTTTTLPLSQFIPSNSSMFEVSSSRFSYWNWRITSCELLQCPFFYSLSYFLEQCSLLCVRTQVLFVLF